jgi:predicted small metal-binding protein
MAKQITCGEVVPGCAWKGSAQTEDELLKQVAAHAAEAHGVEEVTPELASQVKAAIRTR